jgi:hypothetical protein
MGRLFVNCGRWLGNLLLSLVLLAGVGLDLNEMSEGEVPFFNDQGSLTLPDVSNQDFEESMPELQLFDPKFGRKVLRLLPSPPQADKP